MSVSSSSGIINFFFSSSSSFGSLAKMSSMDKCFHCLLLILQLCAMRCILSVSLPPLCKSLGSSGSNLHKCLFHWLDMAPLERFPAEQLVIRIIVDSHPNVDGPRVFPDATNQQFNFITGPRMCRLCFPVSSGAACSSFPRFRPVPRRLPLTVDLHGTQTGLHFLPFLLRGARGLLRRFRRGRRLVRGRATSLEAFIKSFVKTSFDGRKSMLLIAPARASLCIRRKGRGQGSCGAGDGSGAGSANDKAAVIPPAPVATTVIASFAYEPGGIVGIAPVVTFDPPPCACAYSSLK